ncbi:acyl-CoA thioesterase-2 [Bradyrhizobium japonicum]
MELEHTKSPSMSKSLTDLLAILDVERIKTNLFRGINPATRSRRVFGGQIIGQAMIAASRTTEDRLPHSLHGYFIRPGDPKVPIIYQVERLRDGNSYPTRRVTALQHRNAVSAFWHRSMRKRRARSTTRLRWPGYPRRKELSDGELSKRPIFPEIPEIIRRYYDFDRGIELRPVEIGRYIGQKIGDGRVHIWIRTAAKLPDDPALHRSALAYASDCPYSMW